VKLTRPSLEEEEAAALESARLGLDAARELVRRLSAGESVSPTPLFPVRGQAGGAVYYAFPLGTVPPKALADALSARDWIERLLVSLRGSLFAADCCLQNGRLAEALRLVTHQLLRLVEELGRTGAGLKAETSRAAGPNATRRELARTRAAAIERELERLRRAWPKKSREWRAERLSGELDKNEELRKELVGKGSWKSEALLERTYRDRRARRSRAAKGSPL